MYGCDPTFISIVRIKVARDSNYYRDPNTPKPILWSEVEASIFAYAAVRFGGDYLTPGCVRYKTSALRSSNNYQIRYPHPPIGESLHKFFGCFQALSRGDARTRQ